MKLNLSSDNNPFLQTECGGETHAIYTITIKSNLQSKRFIRICETIRFEVKFLLWKYYPVIKC